MKILCGYKFIVTCWYKCKEREEILNIILFWNVWNCIIMKWVVESFEETLWKTKKRKKKKWDVGLDCHFRLKETQTQTTAQLPGFVWNGWWLGICVMSEDLKFSEFLGVNEIYLTHLAKKWFVFININWDPHFPMATYVLIGLLKFVLLF